MHKDKKTCSSLETLTCDCCGIKFDVERHRAKKAKFCSMKCYLEKRWRKKSECPNCGGKPSDGAQFCTSYCQRAYWNKKEPERWKRRKLNYDKKKDALYSLLGGKCVSCGNTDRRVLEIDHIDNTKKLRPAHGMYSTPIRLKLWSQETGNLQILCANCHRIKTWNQSWAR